MPHQQQPSVGRIVHYVSQGSPVLDDGSQRYPSVRRAAIVTAVEDVLGEDLRVSLAVLNPTGLHFDQSVPYAEPGVDLVGGTWHWPERV
ncbi:hypothetical protein ABT081_10440 [Streptomyces sp. NPDC002238]|uniref:hypothetical protein n=1 Tax=Streptomyces sp. NPDC002238 TaxID=3156649 RepID=UPI00332007D8